MLTKQATGVSLLNTSAFFVWASVKFREKELASYEKPKAVLIFKHLRNNAFGRNDTLLFQLKGTAKLLGVVFYTSFSINV